MGDCFFIRTLQCWEMLPFGSSAPVVYKNPVPRIYTRLALKCQKAAPPSTGGVWKSVSHSRAPHWQSAEDTRTVRVCSGLSRGLWEILARLRSEKTPFETTPSFLETGIGGVRSPKIRGGVKILNFQGPLKLTPFYRDSIENRQFRGQKSKFSRGNFRGEFSPPLAFGTFWPPLSWSPTFSPEIGARAFGQLCIFCKMAFWFGGWVSSGSCARRIPTLMVFSALLRPQVRRIIQEEQGFSLSVKQRAGSTKARERIRLHP